MYITRPLAFFPRDLKKLKKKYPQIKKDLEPLIEKLAQGIFEGDKLQGFIGDVYKVPAILGEPKNAVKSAFHASDIFFTS
jgi:hypothetical protein